MLTGGQPAVVLNTYHTGLGLARCLAPFGVRVIGLTPHVGFPGNRSRWLEFRRSADSLGEPERLRDELMALADELGERPVLFPTRDHDITFINRFRTELDRAYLVPFSSPEVVDCVMNKDRLLSAAESIGIAVPKGVSLTDPSEMDRARALRYPCVCKPVYARQWRKPGVWEAVGRQKAIMVRSFNEFADLYHRISALEPQVTVQEWIPGSEEDLLIFGSYCTASGTVAAHFTARKRLQYPALMGTGILVEALPVPQIEAPSRALLAEVGYHGISEIEYKRDIRDGRLHLIEINPRHWDQHQLGAAVGVNLSVVAYCDTVGRSVPPMQQSERSALWIAEREFASHAARALLGRTPLSDLCKIRSGRRVWSVFDADDLRPFLAMLHLIPGAK